MPRATTGTRGALRYPDRVAPRSRTRGDGDAGPARTQHTPRHMCMHMCMCMHMHMHMNMHMHMCMHTFACLNAPNYPCTVTSITISTRVLYLADRGKQLATQDRSR